MEKIPDALRMAPAGFTAFTASREMALGRRGDQLNASARLRSGAICGRVSKGGRMNSFLFAFLFIVVSSLVVSGGLLLAVMLNDPYAQDSTYSLADHELADLANPP